CGGMAGVISADRGGAGAGNKRPASGRASRSPLRPIFIGGPSVRAGLAQDPGPRPGGNDARGNGGERLVGVAARASGGEAHDQPYRNIRRRAAKAAPHQRERRAGEAPSNREWVCGADNLLPAAANKNLGESDDRLGVSENM